ncbi:sn-glycerol-3-phosphate ABC transporter ATP-binding protein UgpC [Vibrio mediterranei]|uniref:ABC transporter ATP-binding protein n=1 Tax=Vibrio mediterranei TaxID=689 RepID=UPI001EFC64CC|nr:sn-glycerol-3-phosphate ABC transporter ATP-binding protein UgpC [Vibrio mediterranei]MCG9627041.1 sn-glycerol-3-phosphate ABC transporter ATP-binding protein UgpC [Vibrio mediterranei]
MTGLSLTNVKKSYGETQVLHGIDLDIDQGEFIVFVGPSGCGKSTLLRMIAGLEDITSGELCIEGARVNELPAAMRGIAMVFQTYALYPHMTVYDNMAFAMRIAKEPKDAIHERVMEAARMLQLEPYLGRLPKALSGGQRQRVAIGRAIVRQPKVFLFDEPLSNLDAALRVQTRIEIANLKEELTETTMIYVTHDQVEAMTLADRIVVLSAGKIEQVGTPLELYTNPANVFVAQFIGSPAMNISKARMEKAGEHSLVTAESGHNVEIPIAAAQELNGCTLQLGIRPEDFLVAEESDALMSGKVLFVESLGEVTLLHINVEGHDETVVAKLPGILDFHKGETIHLKAQPEKIHLFNEEGISLKYL